MDLPYMDTLKSVCLQDKEITVIRKTFVVKRRGVHCPRLFLLESAKIHPPKTKKQFFSRSNYAIMETIGGERYGYE